MQEARSRSYDKAEEMWVQPGIVRREMNWQMQPGVAKYIPTAALQAEEQRRLRRLRQGDR